MANVTSSLQRKDMYRIAPEELIIIGLDTSDGVEHALYDPRISLPLDQLMVSNIAVLGVIEPVVCRKDGDKLLVVDGRQRVRHAREVNKELVKAGKPTITIPMIMFRADEKTTIGTMVSLNEVRRNDDYVMRAERCRRMIEVNGMSVSEASLFFGVGGGTVKAWLAWFDLSPRVHDAVAIGALTPSTATTLAKLSHSEQNARAEEIVEEFHKSGKQLSRAVVSAAEKSRSATQNDEDSEEGGEGRQSSTVARAVSLKPKGRTLRKLVDADMLSPEEKAMVLWILDGTTNAHIRKLLSKLNSEEG